MNIIEQVVSWFSPQRGFARQAWRDALRHYDAGDDSRLNANWRAINTSAEQTDRYSRDTVRARARDLERNSDMLNGVMGAFVRNVVGGGFTLQAETGDTELNQQIEKLWAQWCKKRNCDVTGTQSLSQMLRMAVRRKKVDGGMLFVKRYTGDGLLPFKLQAMEVDELDGSTITARHKGNRVCGGIEYTPYNKPVGYWFRQYSIDGITSPEPVYVEAKDVIFYFSKRRHSQLREMSDMAPTLTRIRDANEFIVAENMKQRVQACVALLIKKVNPTRAGRDNGIGGPRGKEYSRQLFTPGMVGELASGDEPVLINPQGQATDAAAYVKPTDAKLPTRRLKTWGKQFTLSRQTFINDDIGLVTSLPARYAAAARRTINRQCYEILMKNPKIYDGLDLFGKDHKNLLKTDTGITKEAVQAMIMAISTQKDQFEQAITIRPAMLVLPVGMGFDLFTLFNSPTIQTTDNTQAVNPLYRYGLRQVEDPEINRLAGAGAAPWFLLGSTEDTAFIEVDYLNGQEVPSIRRSETVGQLGFVWDIYLDWGIQVMDYRGAVKNPGVKIENSHGTCANGTKTNGTDSNGVHSNGSNSDGNNSDGTCSKGTKSNGSKSNGTNSKGTCSNGKKYNGSEYNGTCSDGMEHNGSSGSNSFTNYYMYKSNGTNPNDTMEQLLRKRRA